MKTWTFDLPGGADELPGDELGELRDSFEELINQTLREEIRQHRNPDRWRRAWKAGEL